MPAKRKSVLEISELDVTVDGEILVVRVVLWSISLERFVGEA